MLHYVYTHTGTEATTGYFSAEPEPVPAFHEALRYLAKHPMDDFMRRHLIRRMAPLDADELRFIYKEAFPDGNIPSAALVLSEELALLNPTLSGILPGYGGKDASGSPLILLRWQELPDRETQRLWVDFFNANMQQHRALKSLEESGLPPLYPDAVGDWKIECGSSFPGLGPAFTKAYQIRLEQLQPKYLQKASGRSHTRPPSSETAAIAEERLNALGITAGREMRHTASLSPVALLRPWNLRLSVSQGALAYRLNGQATTYGRGLTLADARASCLMEMVERASAYLSIGDGQVLQRAAHMPVLSASRSELTAKHGSAVDPNDYPLEVPYNDEPLVWSQGIDAQRQEVYVPVQMAGLFCNLDEIALYDSPGSTGIATGCSMAEAKIAALLEIFERDAEATTPFHKPSCFRLVADEGDHPQVAALLADYAARGINVQFQKLETPLGIPAYKCFVMSAKGVIFRGHGAGLSAQKAIISAMTETPFPYPDGGPSGPMLRKLPVVNFRDLPDYSLPHPEDSLAMLEELLTVNGRPPVYLDLTHESLLFPVVRALVPGLELASDRDSFSRIPLRLWHNYRRLAG